MSKREKFIDMYDKKGYARDLRGLFQCLKKINLTEEQSKDLEDKIKDICDDSQPLDNDFLIQTLVWAADLQNKHQFSPMVQSPQYPKALSFKKVEEKPSVFSKDVLVTSKPERERRAEREETNPDEPTPTIVKQLPITIPLYEKYGEQNGQPVIMYTIHYNIKKVWRRYSEFQSLHELLCKQFEGVAKPALPPKHTISQKLWGLYSIDENFLNTRRQKLERYLNDLFTIQLIKDSQQLTTFLVEKNAPKNVKMGWGVYFTQLSQLIRDPSKLASYSGAYLEYMRENSQDKEISLLHTEFMDKTKSCILVSQYCTDLRTNFDSIRPLLREFQLTESEPFISPFEEEVEALSRKVIGIGEQFGRYKKLINDAYWCKKLISQGIKQNLETESQNLQKRASIMRQKLKSTFQQCQHEVITFFQKSESEFNQWRNTVHPSW